MCVYSNNNNITLSIHKQYVIIKIQFIFRINSIKKGVCSLFFHREYVRLTWNTGWFIAVMFVIVNMLAQLIGCLMILLRKYVSIAVGILFGIIILQVR